MARTGVLLLAGILAISLSAAAPAVVETFNAYPEHTNNTVPGGDPPEYWVYGDATTNNEHVALWEVGSDEGGGGGATGSAGIGSAGSNIFAFGTGSGPNPDQGVTVAIMDFGMQDWGITDGVIAGYLGPNGKDLHGGLMSVRALLTGFTGQIELGFVSDRVVNYGGGGGDEWDEFGGPIYDVTTSFDWYGDMDLNDYTSYHDDEPYSDLSDVKVLGVWIGVISSTTDVSLDGELQIDEILLTPEPATLLLLAAAGLFISGRRFRRS